jgi:hypothetical protein
MDERVNEPAKARPAPAGPAPARAVALSIVIDSRLDVMRARQVAALAGRLGLARVWLRQPWWPLTGAVQSVADSAALLEWLTDTVPVSAGLIVETGQADFGLLDHIGLDQRPGHDRSERLAEISVALSGRPAAVSRWQDLLQRRPGLRVSRLARPASTSGQGPAAVFVPCSAERDLAAEIPAAAAAAAGGPVLAEVTVSVGRTMAEAQARADADDLFAVAGHPEWQGLFGTLEDCQAAAAQLAHAGATELVCYLPLASDLPDVLAQLRSIAIGAAVLRPGEPPSAPPQPPAGWGGRRVTA